MKKIYFLLLAFGLFATANAQIVNIPDANFKAKLLEADTTNQIAYDSSINPIKIDTNNDGEIQISEAQSVYYLYVGLSNINDLIGIENFSSLKILSCSSNLLTNLDISNLTNIEELYCYNNKLTSLDASKNLKLKKLHCYGNMISNLNINNCLELTDLLCYNNQLSTLDISNLKKMTTIYCHNNLLTSINLPIFNKAQGYVAVNLSNNLFEFLELTPNINLFFCDNMPNLKYLFTKNVLFSGFGGDRFSLSNCPNIKYICCNEINLQAMQTYLDSLGYNCSVNTYCSFVPGGIFYTIQGNQKYDMYEDGCDPMDIVIPNLKYRIMDGINKGSLISNASGNYSIPVKEGTHTIIPILENPYYYIVSPSSANVSFPTQTSPFTQDFCITPNGVHPDLEIVIMPVSSARPGFDASYKINFKNKGTQIDSGTVNLNFDDTVFDFVTSNPPVTSQIEYNLSWDYSDLKPFESREISLTMHLNTTAVVIGEVLYYTATISSPETDETQNDNISTLYQTVVNSIDPNDITCLEGTSISPALIGQYVHYMIRFENSGTANAQNVVVKDIIDLSKFDISTLIPTSASNSFTTKISEGNKVEFIFENINLPFDDVTNDGYIAFKIKTLPTLNVGDSFTNDASIYFDYNFPVLTNKAKSTYKTLGTPDFKFSKYFTLYPNPAKEVLNITAKETINVKSISIYNTLGQLVLVIPNAEKVAKIDVSGLTTGNYFIKINSDKGSSNARFIKE
jgi:hypothetical protein